MLITMLKAKLHRCRATGCDLDYEGSCSVDEDLLDAVGILPHERLEIYNITNGERFSTYAIAAPRGGGEIGINGAAARKAMPGDLLIICSYAMMSEDSARVFTPKIAILDEKNQIAAMKAS